MFVYFIQSVNGGPIKIGTAKRPDRRLFFLQTANPYPLIIIGVAAGGRIAETTLHRRFGASRIGSSEWFEPTDDLIALIGTLPTWDQVCSGKTCPEIGELDQYKQTLANLWLAGYSYDDIGGLLGVTRQRAHQILKPFLTEEPRDRSARPKELIENAFARMSGE